MEANEHNKQANKNRTRDTEIKNKLTATRGEVGGDDERKIEGLSETCIKDTWTKPKGSRMEGGCGDSWSGVE